MTKKKLCGRCRERKPFAAFYKQRNGSLTSHCKLCRTADSFYWARSVKEKCVEYLGGQCKHCGIVGEPAIYDFHHLDPNEKDYAISRKNGAFESMKAELDKCALLCANCHRIEHFKQKSENMPKAPKAFWWAKSTTYCKCGAKKCRKAKTCRKCYLK